MYVKVHYHYCTYSTGSELVRARGPWILARIATAFRMYLHLPRTSLGVSVLQQRHVMFVY